MSLTHYWCLNRDTDPITLESEAFHEVPLADEYGWGPSDFVAVPDDGEPEATVERLLFWDLRVVHVRIGFYISRLYKCTLFFTLRLAWTMPFSYMTDGLWYLYG